MTIQEEKALKRHQMREHAAAVALQTAVKAVRRAQVELANARRTYKRANEKLLAYKERISQC